MNELAEAEAQATHRRTFAIISHPDAGKTTLTEKFLLYGGAVQEAGAVGAPMTIFGNNLTGATSVTFNGVAAAFSVVSDTEITTTVPAGATTGSIQVVTASSSTLSSNVAFVVLP